MNKELFLIAHIGGRPIAIASDVVDSVVDIGAVTPVPLADRAVMGLAALRSRVITVIDTYVALGIDAPDIRSRRAIVTQIDGHGYALLVDMLEDIAPFERHPLTPGLVLDGAWGMAARGTIDRDDEPILVIDLAPLIPAIAAIAA